MGYYAHFPASFAQSNVLLLAFFSNVGRTSGENYILWMFSKSNEGQLLLSLAWSIATRVFARPLDCPERILKGIIKLVNNS